MSMQPHNSVEHRVEIVKPKIVDLPIELQAINKKKMILILGHYAIEIRRMKRSKEDTRYRVTFWRYNDNDVEALFEVEAHNVNELTDTLRAHSEYIGDELLKGYVDEISEKIFEYIYSWPTLLRKKLIKELLVKKLGRFESVSPSAERLYGVETYGVETHHKVPYEELDIRKVINSLVDPSNPLVETRQILREELTEMIERLVGQPSIEDIIRLIRLVFSPEIGDLVETTITSALTLRVVERRGGLVQPRPLWVLVVAPPSALKTTFTGLIKDSVYVLSLGDVTYASFSPAEPDKPALVEQMHGRVTLFPTLSSIAEKDEKEARRILSLLESVYDGYFRRDTAQGARSSPVDTVIVGNMTVETYENKFLGPMIAYGSRWLIYRYQLRDEDAIRIALLLERPAAQKLMIWLRSMLSTMLTTALESITRDELYKATMLPEKSNELDVLATLLAKLRVAFHRKRYYEESDDGRGRWAEDIEVTQTDTPIRSRMQLSLFVKANTLIRQVPRIIGLPTIDDHAMRLAAKLALGSSSKTLGDIVVKLVEEPDITQRELARKLKLSPSTINRLVKVLYHVGVLEDTERPYVSEKYAKVIDKYLVRPREELQG